MKLFTRTVSLVPLRRPKKRVAIQLGPKEHADDPWKDRAAWLLEALGGHWTRRTGYTLSPQRVEQFKRLYEAGWSGQTPFGGGVAVFTIEGDESKYSLKEALAKTPA